MPKIGKPSVITALPAAFTRDGELDQQGTREICEFAAASGVSGALALGTTSEFPALSLAERGALTSTALEAFKGLRCVIHVGAASIHEVTQLTEQAKTAGAVELALITPYYLPANDHEIVAFFSAAAKVAGDVDIYAYVFHARTGNSVSMTLMHSLARIPNIVGAKVSGESFHKIMEYRSVVPDSFVLYTGGDDDLGRLHTAGAQGVVSGNASALPKPFVHLANLVAQDVNGEQRTQAEAAVRDVVQILRGDIPRLKEALRMQGVHAGYSRMPLDEPDNDTMQEIERLVTTHG